MASDKFKAILYADDTTLVSTLSAFKQNACAPDCTLLSENINFELTRINEWLSLNKLNLNISKTIDQIYYISLSATQYGAWRTHGVTYDPM